MPVFCLFFFGLPLLGLVLGAIVPPHLYARRCCVALTLNVVGFFLYILPLALLLAINMDSALPPEQRTTADEYMLYLLTTALLFFGMEACVFFLRWLKRYIRIRCDQQ